MRRKERRTPARYGWALLLRRDQRRRERLSWAGREGLSYIEELAEDARERRELALRGKKRAPRTVAQMAREEGISRASVYRYMRIARIELFGRELSDSACYYRVRRDRERGHPETRPCAEPDCPRPLPRGATARRRFCAFHGASHARVRRYRERRRANVEAPAPSG